MQLSQLLSVHISYLPSDEEDEAEAEEEGKDDADADADDEGLCEKEKMEYGAEGA